MDRQAVANRRPRGVLGLGWAALECAASGRTEHRPLSADYPDTVLRRVSFAAGDGLGWRISALVTPRPRPAPWKILVVTGAPSWAEYWAPVMAALPADREMIVVDRPGFAGSEPAACVADIRLQARALSPLLLTGGRQRLLLVGQSYGAGIAAIMAADARARAVRSVVLLSSYLGEKGPTARWLVQAGLTFQGLIPRDLRHATLEIEGHRDQMAHIRGALERVRAPVHMIHGDNDDFAPIDAARRFAAAIDTRHPVRFETVEAANHFLNDGPPRVLLDALEGCIPAPRRPAPWRWPSLSSFRPRLDALPQAAA